MKTLVSFILGIALGLIILVVTVFGIGALEAFICMQISDWFNIPIAKDLAFGQMFGLAVLVGLLTMKSKDTEESDEDSTKVAIRTLVQKVVAILSTWFFAWAVYKIILFYC